jgi:uncharacterized protein
MKIYFILLMLFVASCIDTGVDRGKVLASDYRLFNGTPVQELARAVSTSDVGEIKKLVTNKHLDVNYREAKYGRTLLILSVKNNNYESSKALLELGADVNIHDHYDGTSAIIAASGFGVDDELLTLLLKKGADPNDVEVGERRQGNNTRYTPLLAASGQSLDKVKILVEKGADVNKTTDIGFSPVGYALALDKLDIALYLLEHGADVTMTTREVQNKKFTIADDLRNMLLPLSSGQYQQKMKIVDFLKTKGIDYRSVPIPEYALNKAKKDYPENWQEYLNKY